MAYKPLIPIAGDAKKVSQPQMVENFTQIAAFTTEDHITFNGAVPADLGKHEKVTLTKVADPDQIAIDQATIFAKDDTITTVMGLFWQKEGTGAAKGDVLSMTDFKRDGSKGWTVLPSGIQIAWGTYTIASGNNSGAAQPFSSPFTNDCLGVTLTLSAQGGADHDARDYITYVSPISNIAFTASRINSSYVGATLEFYYIAIGY